MKIKMLKNFKSFKMVLREGAEYEGEFVERIDKAYSIQTLREKGILEVLEDNAEEVQPQEVPIEEEHFAVKEEAPKKPKKKVK